MSHALVSIRRCLGFINSIGRSVYHNPSIFDMTDTSVDIVVTNMFLINLSGDIEDNYIRYMFVSHLIVNYYSFGA